MLFAVYLIITLIPFVIKLKHNYKYYDVFVIVMISILLYNAKELPDVSEMEKVYEYIKNGNTYTDTGIGWFLLCRWGSLLEIEKYKTFMTMIFVFSLLLLRSTINYYIENYSHRAKIWGCFLIYPVMIEGVQLRFFLAETIVLFALRYLTSKSKNKNILFLLFVLSASTIHSSMIVYVLMWMCVVLKKIIHLLTIAGLLVILFGWDFIRVIASFFINSTRINAYFYSSNPTGPLACFVYTVFIFIFILIANSIYQKCKTLEISDKDYSFIQLFYLMTVMACMIIPFTLVNPNFFRLQRICWVMIYIAVAIIQKYSARSIVLPIYFGTKIRIKLDQTIFALCVFGNLAFISIRYVDIIRSYFSVL